MNALKALFSEFRSGKGLKGQLLRGGFWSLVIKVASTLMAVMLSIVLARLLGAEGFGVYSFVFALVSILAIPAQMGLPNLVVRETAKAQALERWDIMKGLWRWATLVALAMSAVLIILGGLGTWYFADQLGPVQTQTLWWGLALVPLVALGNLRGAALRGLRKVVQGQLPEFVIRPALFILLALGTSSVLGMSLGPAEAMMLHVVAGAFAFAVGLALLNWQRPTQLNSALMSWHAAGKWLLAVVPLATVEGMQVLIQSIGVVVLGLTGYVEDSGFFRIAMQGALLVSFGITVAKAVVAPYMARLHAENDLVRLQLLVTANARFALGIAIPVAVTILVLGPSLPRIVFGTGFERAFIPLAILAIGQVVNAFGASAAVLLSMTGFERTTSRCTAVAMLISIVLTVCLAPLIGAAGAALASLTSMVVWQVLLWFGAKKQLGVDSSALGAHFKTAQ